MTQAAAEFVEPLGLMMESDGLPRIAGRLFGALLVSPGPESLDDLAGRLAVSKASISINARLLEQRGLIQRVTLPGDRRDFYRAGEDLLQSSMEYRLKRWRAFHQAVMDVRRDSSLKDPAVRSRLDRLDRAYLHIMEWVTEALEAWNRSVGSKGGRRAADRRKSARS